MKKHFLTTVLLYSLLLGVVLSTRADADEKLIQDQRIKFCISSYRDGFYQKTIDCINEILPTLPNRNDSTEALKYLAVSYGMLNLIDKSENYFRGMLDKSPNMVIDTMEFPPNIALIYNQLRLEKKLEKLNGTAQDRFEPRRNGKSQIVSVLMLGGGILSAIPGGYFLISANDLYKTYQTTPLPQNNIDKAYSAYTNSLIKGCVFSGVSAILLPVSLYGLLHTDKPRGKKISLFIGGNRATVAFSF
jgi:tetratricopeptide (TPR) repeat protein